MKLVYLVMQRTFNGPKLESCEVCSVYDNPTAAWDDANTLKRELETCDIVYTVECWDVQTSYSHYISKKLQEATRKESYDMYEKAPWWANPDLPPMKVT